MPGPRFVNPCLLLSSIVATTAALAQTDDPVYHVEIVVFEHVDSSRAEEDFRHGNDDSQTGPMPQRLTLPRLELETLSGFVPRSERVDRPLPPDAPPATDPAAAVPADPSAEAAVPVPDALTLFDLPAANSQAFAGIAARLPEQFRILTADELELGDVRADLYRRREYRVLGHAGWVQTGVDENAASAIDMRLLGITNPSGTITVYLRRFLHVAIDLDFTDGRGSYWTAFPGTGLELLQHAQTYHHAFEHNAIRSGQLVYIDHPLFGVFVRITPAPVPEESDAAETPGSPAA
jgi:hypothetical protein